MEVSFGGKPCIDASFSLELGFSPSSGSVTISKRESPESLFEGEKGPYALRLADEQSSVLIQQLYVKEIEPDEGVDGTAIYRITIQDKRWKWKYKFISGEFNILTKDKKNVEIFTRKDTQDLINDLFFAIGGEFPEGATSVGIGVDNINLPRFTNIKWDFDNPAQELEKIFKELGFVLSLAPDGSLKVYKKGVGSHTVLPNRLINNKKGKKDWEQPSKLVIAGGRNIRKVKISGWEPVVKSDGTIAGFDEDAVIKATDAIEAWGLNKIRCRQAAANFKTNANAWDVVAGLTKENETDIGDTAGKSDDEISKLRTAQTEKVTKRRNTMKECFLKWFRLPKSEYPKKRFSKLDSTTTNHFRLPILKEIPEFSKSAIAEIIYKVAKNPILTIKAGERISAPLILASNSAAVIAAHGEGLVDENQAQLQFRNPTVAKRLVIGDDSDVSLDYDKGIIKFKEPTGKWIRNGDPPSSGDQLLTGDFVVAEPVNNLAQLEEYLRLADPEITLEFAHEDHFVEYKNQFPYIEDYYYYVYPDNSNTLPSHISKDITIKVIKKPDMRLLILVNTPLNLNELNAQAKLIAEEAYKNIFPETATEYVYAGFVNTRPDGKVTSINWSFTDSGGLTEVKESDLRTTSKLVFGSPPRFYGGRSGSSGSAARTSSVLGSRSSVKVEELATRLLELEREVKRLNTNAPALSPTQLGLINTFRGAFIPLADAENKRHNTIFCRISSYDATTGTYKVDRIGPALDVTWNSAREGWEMGGGSGKFLEWTPA